jgi:hypothetical protein
MAGMSFSHPSLNEEGRTCVPEMTDRADILQLIKVYAQEHPEILTASGFADRGRC